jgi:hypothetical protein
MIEPNCEKNILKFKLNYSDKKYYSKIEISPTTLGLKIMKLPRSHQGLFKHTKSLSIYLSICAIYAYL